MAASGSDKRLYATRVAPDESGLSITQHTQRRRCNALLTNAVGMAYMKHISKMTEIFQMLHYQWYTVFKRHSTLTIYIHRNQKLTQSCPSFSTLASQMQGVCRCTLLTRVNITSAHTCEEHKYSLLSCDPSGGKASRDVPNEMILPLTSHPSPGILSWFGIGCASASLMLSIYMDSAVSSVNINCSLSCTHVCPVG